MASKLKAKPALKRASIGDSTPHVPAAQKTKTKIICTIGPASNTVETIGQLVEAGMSVVRLNFSHGTHEYHANIIKNTRQYLEQSGKIVALMLDTKGPEIRTGKLVDGKPVELQAGKPFTLICDPAFVGDATKVGIDYMSLPTTVKPGDRILVDDGLIALVVNKTSEGRVDCTIDNNGMLGQNKGVNLPGMIVDLPGVTEKDKADIAFGVEQDVDFIAASFIRTAAQVNEIRDLPGVREKGIKIISKIENQEGLNNFEEILEASDGIMVARGDLGVEIPIERVFAAQKMMIRRSNAVGKPVITATQMLESMTKNPRPTRAETTDVANAVLDGSDCVMLSGETANGSYPVETVEMMAKVCREAERGIDHRELFLARRKADTEGRRNTNISDSIASSAVKTAWDVEAALIVCLTETGSVVRAVSKYRPHTMIYAITAYHKTAAQTLVSRGTLPILVDSMQGTDDVIHNALDQAKGAGIVRKGEIVVVTSGTLEGVSGSTNLLKVIRVD